MYTFTVQPDGGESFEVTASTRDVLKWEKTTKGATVARLERNPSIVDLYAIAWHASKRAKLFAGSLAEFEDTCDIVTHDEDQDDDEDGDELGPTSAAH